MWMTPVLSMFCVKRVNKKRVFGKRPTSLSSITAFGCIVSFANINRLIYRYLKCLWKLKYYQPQIMIEIGKFLFLIASSNKHRRLTQTSSISYLSIHRLSFFWVNLIKCNNMLCLCFVQSPLCLCVCVCMCLTDT